jgi:hypothetical protein
MKRWLIAALALAPVVALATAFATAPCPYCVLAKLGLS